MPVSQKSINIDLNTAHTYILKKQNEIVSHFCRQVSLLERKNPELLILVTSFLKKLSCYAVNKDEMKAVNAADKLAQLLTTDNPGDH